MKKNLILIATLLWGAFVHAANFYTCGTNGLTTLTRGGSPCANNNITLAQGDTLFILNGTAYPIQGNIPVYGSVIVEPGGTATLSGNRTINIFPTGYIHIQSGGSITGSGNLTLNNNGTLIIDGNLTLGGSGDLNILGGSATTINGSVNIGQDININAPVNGTGTMSWGSISLGTGGSVNDGDPSAQTPPLDLSSFGTPEVTWDGAQWSDGGIPKSNYRVVIDGTYFSASNGNLVVDQMIINMNQTFTVGDGDVLFVNSSMVNNGTLVLDNGAQINGFGDISGTGEVETKVRFTRAGWQHLGFPLKTTSTLTLADIHGMGISLNFGAPNANQRNIFGWDASTSLYRSPASSEEIDQNAYLVYVRPSQVNSELRLTLSNSDLNNIGTSLNYDYHNPGTSTPGAGSGWTTSLTDGWNLLINPFPSYLDWSQVTLPPSINGAIYIWDGNQYQTWSSGAPNNNNLIAPFQAFFVRNSSGSGAISLPNTVRDTAQGPSYFRSIPLPSFTIELLSSHTRTSVSWVDQPGATKDFDPAFDALHRSPSGDVPEFYMVSDDSLALNISQFPVNHRETSYLGFYFPTDGETFTMQLNKDLLPAGIRVFVEDLYTGAFTALDEANYSFTSLSAAPVQRFRLHLVSFLGEQEMQMNDGVRAWFNENVLNIDLQDGSSPTEYKLFGLDGRLIHSGTTTGKIHVGDLPSGIYILDIADQRIKLLK